METGETNFEEVSVQAFRPSYEGWKHRFYKGTDGRKGTFRPSYEGWKLA